MRWFLSFCSSLVSSEDLSNEVKFTSSRHYDRLDKCLASETPIASRTHWATAIVNGDVSVDNVVCLRKARKVAAGAVVEATLPLDDDSLADIVPENIAIDVLYEDDDLIVVNKAAGMVTHPGAGHRRGTLANALAHRFLDAPRAGIVHRLDKGTSGVMVAAKRRSAHERLSDAFRRRDVDKVYLAVCAGVLPELAVVDQPIARDPTHRERMAVEPLRGKPAKSRFRRLATDGSRSVAEIAIESGRTHQIRVHLRHLRHPVLGDDVYGDREHNRLAAAKPFEATRPLLHAWHLDFPHPADPATRLHFVAPLPDDMTRAVRLVSGF